MEEGKEAFKIVTGKSTGRRTLQRTSRRLENNIRMDLEEIGVYKRNCIDSAQDRDYCWFLVTYHSYNLDP